MGSFARCCRKSGDRFLGVKLDEKQQATLNQFSAFYQAKDADNSGELDKEEFTKLHADLVAGGYKLGSAEDTMTEIDKSGEGLIHFNEFIAWAIKIGCL